MTLELTIIENNKENKENNDKNKILLDENIGDIDSDKMNFNNEQLIKKYNYCVYSSVLFLLLAILARIYKYRKLAISLFVLFITSIIFHSNKNNITRVFDKLLLS